MLFEAAELILAEAARLDEELDKVEKAGGDHGGGDGRRLQVLRHLLDDVLQTSSWPTSSSSRNALCQKILKRTRRWHRSFSRNMETTALHVPREGFGMRAPPGPGRAT